jgi:hypothetical protein
MSGGTLVSKYFETLRDAVLFSVYKTPFGSFYGIDRVEE